MLWLRSKISNYRVFVTSQLNQNRNQLIVIFYLNASFLCICIDGVFLNCLLFQSAFCTKEQKHSQFEDSQSKVLKHLMEILKFQTMIF